MRPRKRGTPASFYHLDATSVGPLVFVLLGVGWLLAIGRFMVEVLERTQQRQDKTTTDLDNVSALSLT